MALYSYKKEKHVVRKKFMLSMSYLSLTVGTLLMFWAFYPVISFEIYSRLFIMNQSTSPIPKAETASSIELAGSVLGDNVNFSNNLSDFTHASVWFPTSKAITHTTYQKKISVKEYSLSIPKLNIEDARVQVGEEDLTKGLVHYQPVSMPGERGNVVIFGHSTLPQLYNVKDYKTIFTYLPSLNKGDKIIVKIGDSQYEYEVFEMFVVKPDQVSVLEQTKDASIITLITCVPPGTFWNRLVVRARLAALPSSL